MMLFQSKEFGNVLHTGDFRVSEQMLRHPILFPAENEPAEELVYYQEFDNFG